MTRGSVMNAMIRMVPPQRGQVRGSTSKMRRINAAQRRRAALHSGSVGEPGTGPAGAAAVAAASCWRRALSTLEWAP